MKKTNKMAIVAAMVLMAACLALVIFAMGKDADPQDGSTTESLSLTTPEEEVPTACSRGISRFDVHLRQLFRRNGC